MISSSFFRGKKVFYFTVDSVTVVLTELEIRIMEQLCKGLEDKEASEAIQMKLNTFKTHLKSLFTKLDALNRTHAVVKYLRLRGRLLDNEDMQ